MSPAASPKIDGVQYARAIAAMLVVLAHSIQRASIEYFKPEYAENAIALFSVTGVWTFFVISGFIMIFVSWNRFGAYDQAKTFMIGRIVRIVPLYWLFTILYFLITNHEYTLIALIKSLTFVPHLNPWGEVRPVVALGWTLNYEMLFYSVVAISLIFRRSIGIAMVTCIILSLSVAHFVLAPTGVIVLTWTSPLLLLFAVGGLIGAFVRATPGGMTNRAAMLKGLAALAVAAALVNLAVLIEQPAWSGNVAIASLCVLAMACSLIDIAWWSPVARVMGFAGDASYSIYLAHPFALIAIGLACRFLAIELPLAMTIALYFVGGTIAGMVTYVVIERPMTNWLSRHVVRKARAPACVPPVSLA